MFVDYRKIAFKIAKIRDVYGKFDISYFKSLNDPKDINEYVESSLQELGRSTRAVFTLSSSKVLKIATNDKDLSAGVAQNEAEVAFFTDPLTKPVSTKVLDYHPKYYWIISELVKPISDHELEKFAGGSMSDIDYVIFRIEDDRLDAKDLLELKANSDGGFPNDEFIILMNDLKSSGMKLNDLALSSSWGKTSSGNIVILDYGLTPEILSNIQKSRAY